MEKINNINSLEQALNNEETTVLDLQIAEESNIMPMFASGTPITEMFGPCIPKAYFER